MLRFFLMIILKCFDGVISFYWKLKYKEYRYKYQLSSTFRFNGKYIKLYGAGFLKAGYNSYIGEFSTLQISPGCQISIGNNVRISHNVRIYIKSNIANQDFALPELVKKKGDVVIGDYVWIGVNSYIGPGVIIGDNAVVGANSVVIKSVEPYSIVAGVPAQFIRYKQCKILIK